MNEDKPSAADSSDLDWQAFRYLSGEMSPDEIVDFETLLAEDQRAREALAGSVELTQALAVCEAQPALPVVSLPGVSLGGSRSNTWLTRSLWLAIGATAALVMVMVYRAGGSGEVASRSNASQGDHDAAGRKALLWTEIHSELAEQDDLSVLAEESPLLASYDMETIDFDEAPTWMTTAILSLQDQDLKNELQEN